MANRALFLVQPEMLRSEPDVLELQKYSLLVCNPAIPVKKIREAVKPDVKLLFYIQSDCFPAYGPEDPFYCDYRTAMLPFSVHPTSRLTERLKNEYGNYFTTLSFEAFDALATWINSRRDLDEFDGIYLDNAWGVPPLRWLRRRCVGSMSIPETESRWKWLIDYFLERLRAGYGNSRIVVGNVGRDPEFAPRALDAITIEAAHLKSIGDRAALAFFRHMRHPEFNVAWNAKLSEAGSVMPGIIL